MNKRLFGLFGVVAAVGVGVLVWKGVIPPKNGAQGTIGVANRYQSEQIAASDVAIDPTALNDLLQSDVIHRLAKDPEFKKVVTSESFKSLAASGEFQRLVKSDDFLALIRRADFNKFATSGALAEFGNSGIYHEGTHVADAGKTTQVAHDEEMNKGIHVAHDEQMNKTVAAVDWNKVSLPKEYEKVAKSPEFQKLLTTNPDFAKVITTESFAKTLAASPEFGKIIASADFQKVMSTDLGAKALATPEFEKTILQGNHE